MPVSSGHNASRGKRARRGRSRPTSRRRPEPVHQPGSTGRRVAFIDAYPHVFTGAQQETLLLVEGLRARGFDAHVVTTAPGRYVDEAERRGVPTHVLPIPPSLRVYGGETRGGKAVRAALAVPGVWRRVARY